MGKIRKLDLDNRRGLSEVVGYVMLVVIGMSLAMLVYGWLKGQLPGKEKECPSGISLIVSNHTCTSKGIKITVRNEGRFNLEGYIVRGINETGFKKELTIRGEGKTSRFFYEGGNLLSLKPEEKFTSGDLKDSELENIDKVEIIPLKLIEDMGRVQCSRARITHEVNC